MFRRMTVVLITDLSTEKHRKLKYKHLPNAEEKKPVILYSVKTDFRMKGSFR